MPTADALSSALTFGIGARRRPTGRPRKIVKPATAPSRAMLAADMGTHSVGLVEDVVALV